MSSVSPKPRGHIGDKGYQSLVKEGIVTLPGNKTVTFTDSEQLTIASIKKNGKISFSYSKADDSTPKNLSFKIGQNTPLFNQIQNLKGKSATQQSAAIKAFAINYIATLLDAHEIGTEGIKKITATFDKSNKCTSVLAGRKKVGNKNVKLEKNEKGKTKTFTVKDHLTYLATNEKADEIAERIKNVFKKLNPTSKAHSQKHYKSKRVFKKMAQRRKKRLRNRAQIREKRPRKEQTIETSAKYHPTTTSDSDSSSTSSSSESYSTSSDSRTLPPSTDSKPTTLPSDSYDYLGPVPSNSDDAGLGPPDGEGLGSVSSDSDDAGLGPPDGEGLGSAPSDSDDAGLGPPDGEGLGPVPSNSKDRGNEQRLAREKREKEYKHDYETLKQNIKNPTKEDVLYFQKFKNSEGERFALTMTTQNAANRNDQSSDPESDSDFGQTENPNIEKERSSRKEQDAENKIKEAEKNKLEEHLKDDCTELLKEDEKEYHTLLQTKSEKEALEHIAKKVNIRRIEDETELRESIKDVTKEEIKTFNTLKHRYGVRGAISRILNNRNPKAASDSASDESDWE